MTYYENIYVAFYNDNPMEDRDIFLGAWIRKYEMEDFIRANYQEIDIENITVCKVPANHFVFRGNEDRYWQDWRTKAFETVDISKIYKKGKK